MNMHYTIAKDEQHYTLHVSEETHVAIMIFAKRHKLTMVEATYLLLRTGIQHFWKIEKEKDRSEEVQTAINEAIEDGVYKELGKRKLRLTDEELEAAE